MELGEHVSQSVASGFKVREMDKINVLTTLDASKRIVSENITRVHDPYKATCCILQPSYCVHYL
jgi:hypothetical protein